MYAFQNKYFDWKCAFGEKTKQNKKHYEQYSEMWYNYVKHVALVTHDTQLLDKYL